MFTVLSLLALANFGAEGTTVPSGAITVSHSLAANEGQSSFTDIAFAPEVSYFIVENFAVGAGLRFNVSAFDGYLSYGYGVSPTVGYYVPLGDSFGIFPKVALSYLHTEFNIGGAGLPGSPAHKYTQSALSFAASAPMLFHVDHFFMGFGPQVSKYLFSRYENVGVLGEDDSMPVTLAFTTTIGGWF